MRMDVVNKTRLEESFKVHQLSCVGKEWSISLLQPIDAFSPFEFLMSGQALSCCFKLKVGTRKAPRFYLITNLFLSFNFLRHQFVLLFSFFITTRVD